MLAIFIILSTTVDMIVMVWMLADCIYCFSECFSFEHVPDGSKKNDMVRRPEFDEVLLRAGNPHDISVYDHRRYIFDEWFVDFNFYTFDVRFRVFSTTEELFLYSYRHAVPPRVSPPHRLFRHRGGGEKGDAAGYSPVAMGWGKPHRHPMSVADNGTYRQVVE